MFALIFAVQANAGSDSLKIWRFTYDYSDVNMKKQGDDDMMHLDVKADGSSLFYSIYEAGGTSVMVNGGDVDAIQEKMKSQKFGCGYTILRDVSTDEITFVAEAPDKFFYKEAAPKQEWIISDKDTMTVCGYLCKKATADFAGRTWTAWFSEDLPVSCGPWKLSGLPGLILSAYDADNYFKFTCVGMEQTTSPQWNVSGKGYLKCTNDEYQKQLRLQAADPVNYALRKFGLATVSAGDVTVIGDDGKRKEELPKDDKVFIEKMPGDSK